MREGPERSGPFFVGSKASGDQAQGRLALDRHQLDIADPRHFGQPLGHLAIEQEAASEPQLRLPAAFKRDPPPFASTMAFAGGVVNATAHPFRTVAAAAQDGVAVPMRARLGFTNGGICAAIHQRLRARVLGA